MPKLPVMIKALVCCLFLSFTGSMIAITFAQTIPVKAWDRALGGSSLQSLQQTADGYILGGYSSAGIGGNKSQPSRGGVDYWLVKLDMNGNKIWDKTFGGSGDEYLESISQISDGGFILGGWSTSGQSGDKSQSSRGGDDYWVVRTDSSGNKLWDKTLGGNDKDHCATVQQTPDGGFIIGGWSVSGLSGDKSQASKGGGDYWIIKLNAAGNILWDKTIGGNSLDIFKDLQITSDGGYIIGGNAMSGVSGDKSQPSKGNEDYWVIKLDSLGNKIWDKTIGTNTSDWLHGVQQTSDGGYILGGYTNAGISGDKTEPSRGRDDFWIAKLDASGNKIWDKTFGGDENDQLYSIEQTKNGGYIFGGRSSSGQTGDKSQPLIGGTDFWVVESDAAGNKLWDKTTGGTGSDWLFDLKQTTDEGFIFGGHAGAGISGDKSEVPAGYWVIKFFVPPTIRTFFSQTLLCAGSTYAVTFTFTSSFHSNNIFTTQLSDATGSFNNPVTIGTLNGSSGNNIPISIPTNIPPGNRYRVRVIASSPITIGADNGIDIMINNYLATVPSVAICDSGSVTLTASGAPANGSYQWYSDSSGITAITGATNTTFITPILAATTTYYVTVITASGCESNSRIPVTVTVNSTPVKPTISLSDGYLFSSANTGNQWYLNNIAIAGATDQQYLPQADGSYTVKVTLNNCEALSEPIIINEAVCRNNIKLFPNPSRGKFLLSLADCKAATTVTIFNSIGQQLSQPFVLSDLDKTTGYSVDLSSYKSGLYILKLENKYQTSHLKLILE